MLDGRQAYTRLESSGRGVAGGGMESSGRWTTPAAIRPYNSGYYNIDQYRSFYIGTLKDGRFSEPVNLPGFGARLVANKCGVLSGMSGWLPASPDQCTAGSWLETSPSVWANQNPSKRPVFPARGYMPAPRIKLEAARACAVHQQPHAGQAEILPCGGDPMPHATS